MLTSLGAIVFAVFLTGGRVEFNSEVPCYQLAGGGGGIGAGGGGNSGDMVMFDRRCPTEFGPHFTYSNLLTEAFFKFQADRGYDAYLARQAEIEAEAEEMRRLEEELRAQPEPIRMGSDDCSGIFVGNLPSNATANVRWFFERDGATYPLPVVTPADNGGAWACSRTFPGSFVWLYFEALPSEVEVGDIVFPKINLLSGGTAQIVNGGVTYRVVD